MSAESICDGCGKRQPMSCYSGNWHKPASWFERTPEGESTITACSRECIEKAEAKRSAATGKPPMTVVLPI